MATAVLNTDYLEFKNGATVQAKLTATADIITLAGASGAAVELKNLAPPLFASSAATKTYVDNTANGLSWHYTARVATTENGVFSTAFVEGASVDGVTLSQGNRILIKNQLDPIVNGIYAVSLSGEPVRVNDMLAGSNAKALAIFVEEGTVGGDQAYVCTANAGSDIVGTNPLEFTKFTGVGQIVAGVGLDKVDATNTLDVDSTVIRTVTDQEMTGLKTFSGGVINSAGQIQVTGGSVHLADDIVFNLGSSNELKLKHTTAGNTEINSTAGNLTVDNEAPTGKTILQLGSDTSATAVEIKNNSSDVLFSVDAAAQGTMAGNLDVTNGLDVTGAVLSAAVGLDVTGGLVHVTGTGVTLDDSVPLNIGSDSDLVLSHSGTAGLIKSVTGNLVIDNENVTATTSIQLGTDDAATKFNVLNNTGTELLTMNAAGAGTVAGSWTVDNLIMDGATIGHTSDTDLLTLASGLLTVAGATTSTGLITSNNGFTNTSGNVLVSGGSSVTINDSIALNIGTTEDLKIVHDATNNIITSKTGNLYIDNTLVTGATILRTGTDTAATKVEVVNDSNVVIATFGGDKKVSFSGEVNVDLVTDATSATTGALICDGGIGVAKQVYSDADMYSTAFNTHSDERLKTNIVALTDDDTQKLSLIQPKYFNWKDSKRTQKKQCGFIAQEVREVIPEAVEETGEYLSVNYSYMVPLLVKKVQQLEGRLAKMEKKPLTYGAPY